MSIGLQSYPELYTTLLGFGVYDKLWELLTLTGIAYIPFIGMILRNFNKAYINNGSGNTSQGSLRTLELNLITAILIILFAVAPCIPLETHATSYTPQCGPKKGETSFPGDTGTSYDKAFTLPNDEIRVPMWWYLVISVSEGMTNAANSFVGCTPNLRKMVTQVGMTKIFNPELTQQLKDFENMCYLPAKLQFKQDREKNYLSRLNRVNKFIEKYGEGDTEWAGSHSFNQVYYQDLKATKPVPGFPYDAFQDLNNDLPKANQPTFGSPSCYDWWNDSTNGIKQKVLDTLPKDFVNEFKKYLQQTKSQDEAVRRIISNTSFNIRTPKSNFGIYSNAAASVGILFQQLQEYPKLYAATQAAPIIQALLLLMIYTFLPFALVFSSYRANSLITGGLLIFSVIFWGFIWHLVSWTDNALMQALYTSWFSKQGPTATLVDMIIGSLIIFGPLFWFIFMSVMGVSIGDVVSSFTMGSNRLSGQAAKQGSELTKDAATTAMTSFEL